MLRFLALKLCVRVRKDVHAVVTMDRARLSASVARQARVTGRMHVAGAHALAHLEVWRHRYVPARGIMPAAGDARHHIGGQWRRGLARTGGSVAAVNFRACDQTAGNHQPNQTSEPFLVVTHAKIFRWRNQFDLVAAGIDIPLSPRRHRTIERERYPLPTGVEDGLVLFIFEHAHTLHAAHVVHTVHAAPPACPSVTFATPTIASRVTSAASSSSLSFSLPAGRSGSTR